MILRDQKMQLQCRKNIWNYTKSVIFKINVSVYFILYRLIKNKTRFVPRFYSFLFLFPFKANNLFTHFFAWLWSQQIFDRKAFAAFSVRKPHELLSQWLPLYIERISLVTLYSFFFEIIVFHFFVVDYRKSSFFFSHSKFSLSLIPLFISYVYIKYLSVKKLPFLSELLRIVTLSLSEIYFVNISQQLYNTREEKFFLWYTETIWDEISSRIANINKNKE